MHPLAPEIVELLSDVKAKIRSYVIWEGVAAATVWLIATFWLSWLLDYGPVRLGANEMPRGARGLLLVINSGVLAWILYRWIVRRALARLKDESVALLVERKYPAFAESLVTSVEFQRHEAPDPLVDDMLRRAHQQATRLAATVDVDTLFDFWPLRRVAMAALLLLGSLAVFAIFFWPTIGISIRRLYGLSDQPYPRQTHLEMIGFEGRQVTVARGSDLTIKVQADADRSVPPPKICTIYYRTTEGDRGRVHMSRKGAPRDGFQQYTFEGKPFRSILSDIEFDVVGNDQRIRDQRVRVVDSPQVVAVSIDCVRPAYTQLTDTTLDYYPGMKIPRGSRLTLRLTANKPLVRAEVRRGPDQPATVLRPVALPSGTAVEAVLETNAAPQQGPAGGLTAVTFDIPALDEDYACEVELWDTDGITSQQAYRLALVAVPDFPPNVQVRLQGIGAAITSEARLPVSGEVSDDYGVAETWFELDLSNDDVRAFPLPSATEGPLEAVLDLREERIQGVPPLTLSPDSTVVLSVKASDRFDLAAAFNVGQSDRYELEVVSPNQLIALLEARELGLRRRFEQIILEMREARDSLQRVQFDDEDVSQGSLDDLNNESDTGRDGISDNDLAERAKRRAALRGLRVQRGEQHSRRAAAEVLGVALSFDDIGMELVNNRVDAQDRVERIERAIANPLRDIAERMLPDWDLLLVPLREVLEESGDEAKIGIATQEAVAQADVILVAMEAVLEKMLELETYNELVDLVRTMIKDMDELSEKTKNQRKKSALDLLK